jgi:sortase (surface protein transpeptidase)
MDVLDGDLPLLTLTTCNPQFSNRERMIVHAVLQRAEPRVDGQLPAELVEGV